jgi:hypothetical protein
LLLCLPGPVERRRKGGKVAGDKGVAHFRHALFQPMHSGERRAAFFVEVAHLLDNDAGGGARLT